MLPVANLVIKFRSLNFLSNSTSIIIVNDTYVAFLHIVFAIVLAIPRWYNNSNS